MDDAALAAHIEIQQVLYRYCRGVDRGDASLIASVYHEGATDDHGTWSGPGKDFGAYLVPGMDGTPLAGQHHITNTLIEVTGDEAAVESYFMAFHPETADGRHRYTFVSGRYLDHFARRLGSWGIVHRKVVIDIARPLSEASDWPAAAAFPRGARRGADPSANLFREFSDLGTWVQAGVRTV